MVRQRAVVIAPGRGTYNKAELGYLARHHAARDDLIAMFDRRRLEIEQPSLTELDRAAVYSTSTHMRGDNASSLIFACSYADWLAVDRDRFDIVAVTGNSMGWYTILAAAGALDATHGFELANAMGKSIHDDGIGGQLIHIFLDEDWRPIPGRREELMDMLAAIPDLYLSIDLGGMIVFAGTEEALKALSVRVPQGPGNFPMRLSNHAAFHSPLLQTVSEAAKAKLPMAWFGQPNIPMIDGRGHIWRPHMTDSEALWDYTLGHQIVRTYDFTRAVTVAVREFAPDCLIILGPGEKMGGAVIQSLLAARWRGWDSKVAFQADQQDAPFVLSMGQAEQRSRIQAQ